MRTYVDDTYTTIAVLNYDIMSSRVMMIRLSRRLSLFLLAIASSILLHLGPHNLSGISVKNALQVDERKTIAAIIDEVKNMFDYKAGHCVHQIDLTYEQSHNILRSFMFIKQKVFPDRTSNKMKAHLVTNCSQKVRHLYDLVSSATVSLQAAYLLFNIASTQRQFHR